MEDGRSAVMAKGIGTILSTFAFAVLFVLCLAFVSIRVLGLATYIVTGGSMEPSIHKGALVLVQPVLPAEIQVGDVITFQQYGQTTTHRVVEIRATPQGRAFVTKGDANTVADPEPKAFAAQVGVVRAAIPAAGYVVAGVQAYWRLALTLLAAVVFFGCAGVLVFRTEKAPRPVPAPRLVRRALPVRVDVDEAWSTHLAWLQRSHQRETQVA
jgi:signal peptidase